VLAVIVNLLTLILFASPTADAAEKRLLLLGDSLIAGYGLPIEDGFATQLQRALIARGHDVAVLNASVSGDTSAGGLARLGWALAEKPTHSLVELGANDALRGLDPTAMERNLEQIVQQLQDAGSQVMLAGMRAPRNLGQKYRVAFEGAYIRLAEQYDVLLYPFFLEGLQGHGEYIQSDGLHPNAAGVAVVVANILPSIEALLSKEPPS